MLKCRNSDKYQTATINGIIPHIEARIGGYTLTMPVKITMGKTGAPVPTRDIYGYCYALPAGRVISLNGEISR